MPAALAVTLSWSIEVTSVASEILLGPAVADLSVE